MNSAHDRQVVPRWQICYDRRRAGRSGSVFFFSSRRRHTRCGRDWSSDVCSSDLKKNALTDAMYGALADALEQAEASADIRVVVLRAEGEIFSAGNDLGEFAAQSRNQGPAVRQVERFLRNLVTARTPLVAAVQGKAVGVGTTMLLHCDLVVLAEDAQLMTPFVNLALVPEASSSLLMPLRIGHVRAFEMFALGDPVEARDALAWGLANRV